MEKGKYFRCIKAQSPIFTIGKIYPIIKEGFVSKQHPNDYEFSVIDDTGKERIFLKYNILTNLNYKTFFVFNNVNHSFDDIFDKYNMYKELYKMMKNKRYLKMTKVIKKKFKEITGGDLDGKKTKPKARSKKKSIV